MWGKIGNMRRSLHWLFVATLVVSAIGTRWEAAWNFVFGGASPLWRRVVSELQVLDRWLLDDLGMFPVGIAIGILGLFITWLWSDIWDKVAGYDNFLTRLKDVYQENKSIFHMLLNQAYSKWQGGHLECPDNLDALVDKTTIPCKRQFLSGDVQKVQSSLNIAIADLWRFCVVLYEDIEMVKSRKDHKPSFLSREENIALSEARKKLVDFWDGEARRIYSVIGSIFRKWWLFRQVKGQLED